MIHKLTIAALLAGLFMPASGLPSGDPSAQHTIYQDGFFYSAGRSYLGVDIRDITSDRVSALKLKEERGVEITMVDQDSPAGKAGLKEHDVILEFNGARVESEEQLRRMIRETPPGRTVALGISREGNPLTINVQLADRGKAIADGAEKAKKDRIVVVPPSMDFSDFSFPFDVQISTYTPSLGIQVENLGQQLGQFFGVKDGEGLLVKSVEKGSAAEKAGMKAGDIITHADNEKISDRADLRRILRSHLSGGKITVGIVRDKREQNLTIDLPARKPKDSSGMEIVLPEMDTFEDMRSMLQDLGPKINAQVQEAFRQIQPQLVKAQLELRKLDLEKSLRQAQKQLQEQLKKQQKEWFQDFNSFI